LLAGLKLNATIWVSVDIFIHRLSGSHRVACWTASRTVSEGINGRQPIHADGALQRSSQGASESAIYSEFSDDVMGKTKDGKNTALSVMSMLRTLLAPCFGSLSGVGFQKRSRWRR
jgi:hypothetical protein